MTPSGQISNTPTRYPELDGLRGLAIGLVLVWHFGAQQIVAAPGTALSYLKLLLSFSWAGVDLFFVLSGFLLGSILIQQRGSPVYFQAFYLRRACRILPIYYLLVVSYLLCMHFLPLDGSLRSLFAGPALPEWSYLTFTQNILMAVRNTFGHAYLSATWSLAVEEQFYLVLPLLLRWWDFRKLLPFLIGAILCVSPLRIAMYHFLDGGPLATYVLLPCRADTLLLGVVAAGLYHEPATRAWLRAHERRLWAALGALGLVLLGLVVKKQGDLSIGMAAFGYTALGAFFAVLLLLSISSGVSPFRRALCVAPLRWLGKVSYGVYLIHFPVLVMVQAALGASDLQLRNPQDLLVTLAALGVTLGVAAVSFRFIETPVIAWGHRLRYQT